MVKFKNNKFVVLVILILSLFLIFGCGPGSTKIKTVEVIQPIATPCPTPPLLIRPNLPDLKTLPPLDKECIACIDQNNASNLLEVFETLKNYIEKLETILDSYKEIQDQEEELDGNNGNN